MEELCLLNTRTFDPLTWSKETKAPTQAEIFCLSGVTLHAFIFALAEKSNNIMFRKEHLQRRKTWNRPPSSWVVDSCYSVEPSVETKRDCSIVFTRTLEVASFQGLADSGTWVGGQSPPCCLDVFPAAAVDAAVEGSAMHPESAIASFAWSQMFLGAVTVSSWPGACSISPFSLCWGKAIFFPVEKILRAFSES